MHGLYRRHQEQVYFVVTINELLGQGIDILYLTPLVEVRLAPWSHYNMIDVLSALGSLYSQLFGTRKVPIALDIPECKALQIIEDIVRWDIRYDEKLEMDVPFYRQAPNYRDYNERHIKNYHSMHLDNLEFVDDYSPFMARMYLLCRHRPSAGQSMSAEEESRMNELLVDTR